MNSKFPYFGVGAALFLFVVLGSWDMGIRASNSGRVKLHQQEAAFTDQAVKGVLGRINNACAYNAKALTASRELEAAYGNSPQTIAGLTAYRELADHARPKVIATLTEPNLSSVLDLFFELDNIVERHTMSVTSREISEQNASGSLFAQIRRDWNSPSSP